MRNRFTNPNNVRVATSPLAAPLRGWNAGGTTYDWEQNHTAEEGMGQARNISRAANTGSTGAVKQQGDDGPLIVSLSGTILKRSQLRAFWAWFELCRTQTIYFTDYDGQEYEVQITSFVPKRVRKLSYSGRDSTMAHHYYEYTMTMEVYVLKAGDMLAAGVTP